MDIARILTKNFQGSEWMLVGDTYDGLSWNSKDKKPTEAELKALWAETEMFYEIARVKEARQSVYQIESDPIFFKWQRGEATKQEWLDAVKTINDAHPYPSK
jgi:hypothetical protein